MDTAVKADQVSAVEMPPALVLKHGVTESEAVPHHESCRLARTIGRAQSGKGPC